MGHSWSLLWVTCFFKGNKQKVLSRNDSKFYGCLNCSNLFFCGKKCVLIFFTTKQGKESKKIYSKYMDRFSRKKCQLSPFTKHLKDQLHEAKKFPPLGFPNRFGCWLRYFWPGDIDVKGVETSRVMEMIHRLDVVRNVNIKVVDWRRHHSKVSWTESPGRGLLSIDASTT